MSVLTRRSLSHSALRGLIFASLALLNAELRAELVEPVQARVAAASYVGRNYAPSAIAKSVRRLAAPSTLTVSACRPLEGAGGVIGYIADLSPSGFVLLRADSDLPPLKLHSASGTYEGLPAGFRAVLEAELAGELAELAGSRDAQQKADSRYRSEWLALTQTAALDASDLSLASSGLITKAAAGTILLSTAWDQNNPYNAYAPEAAGGTGGRASIGCGPLAMAQILRYHKKPVKPARDASYTDSDGSCVGTHALSDAGLGNYDWSNMPGTLTTASPLAEKLAVGRLTYHCGVAMEADFEASATSVISQFFAASALREVFGYACEDYQPRTAYSTAVWLAKVQADIDANRPVYYTMVSALGGHAVVCDGYRNGSEIHLNFGLASYGDAWYNVDSVVFYGYTWARHEAVFGITPDATPGTNTLTVVSGTGGGAYLAGTEVAVSADQPAAGYRFGQWSVTPAGTDLGGAFVQTQATVTVVMPNHAVTLSAVFKPFNRPPVLAGRSPTNEVVTVSENATASLRVIASDSTDPDTTERGMVSVTWTVDGLLRLTTQTGAPSAITSTLNYTPGTNTVVGAASRDVRVRAVALDRQGGSSETNWTVRVLNAPASQTIAFKAQPTVALGGTNFSPGATASSGLPVVYTSSNESVAQVVDGLLRIVGAGAATITASQPGNFDFKAAAPVRQTLAVKASLTAEVPSGGGTVSGAGLYSPGTKVALTARAASGYTFLRWEDGAQAVSRSLSMPGSNITVRAWFGVTADVPPPAVADPGPQQATVGVFFSMPLDVQSASLPSVTVSGLPAGLRYNAMSKAVEGVPSASVTNKAVTVSARNVTISKTARTFTLTVVPLPAWAQGTFGGVCVLWEKTGWGVPALADLTVSPLGKISGKFAAEGTNYTFAAGSYTNAEALSFAALASAGAVKIPLAVTVIHPEVYEGGPAALGAAQFRLDGAPQDYEPFTLWRNVWKDADMVADATNYAGYYTATLSGGDDFGLGYLLFTVDKAGGVKVAGKLADGTAVSLSRTLTLDASGEVVVTCHATPSAYKGGCFHLPAAFVRREGEATIVREALNGLKLWESRNPQATGNYAAGGFSRDVAAAGGWYDTVGNLYRYYAGRLLEVGTAGGPTPELAVGTNRYESAWWDPDGLALTPVTNRYGIMTGLAAPLAVAPVKVNGAYDYAGTNNAVGLTVSLSRATGVFKGSFKAWFDYGATHTYKGVVCEGVLTPEREDTSSGAAGGGFFLWSDRASYLDAAGRTASYGFNESYSFLLSSQADAE